ncbi:MAG: hypothetical protein HFK08_05190 [Clostridia bacterium]|nr:hypothetical protein [Clostridia bacterium]
MNENNILTAENATESMIKALEGKTPCRDTMLLLSFYMDFAISTELIELIDEVHQITDSFYLEHFS